MPGTLFAPGIDAHIFLAVAEIESLHREVVHGCGHCF